MTRRHPPPILRGVIRADPGTAIAFRFDRRERRRRRIAKGSRLGTGTGGHRRIDRGWYLSNDDNAHRHLQDGIADRAQGRIIEIAIEGAGGKGPSTLLGCIGQCGVVLHRSLSVVLHVQPPLAGREAIEIRSVECRSECFHRVRIERRERHGRELHARDQDVEAGVGIDDDDVVVGHVRRDDTGGDRGGRVEGAVRQGSQDEDTRQRAAVHTVHGDMAESVGKVEEERGGEYGRNGMIVWRC